MKSSGARAGWVGNMFKVRLSYACKWTVALSFLLVEDCFLS